MNKKLSKILSKVALFLVIFGFFQPVACDQKGFDLAQSLIEMEEINYFISAIGLYVTFFVFVVSIVYTLILLITKKNICTPKVNKVDFSLLLASIVGGLITFFFVISEFDIELVNQGFYIIIAGWVISLIFYFLRE